MTLALHMYRDISILGVCAWAWPSIISVDEWVVSSYFGWIHKLVVHILCEWIWIKTPLQIYDVITQGLLSNPHAIMPITCLLSSLSFILILKSVFLRENHFLSGFDP